MDAVSLRERSKERRYRAILLAGMRLFAEQGYEATTVAQIAEEAEVSPRSVSAYFPTKLDIATASSAAAARRLMDSFTSWTPERSIVDLVDRWLRDEPRFVPDEEWRVRAAMLHRNPLLHGARAADPEPLVAAAATAIAAELDVDPDDAAVQIILGIISGVVLRFELMAGYDRGSEGVLSLAHDALAGAFAAVRRARGKYWAGGPDGRTEA
ncbi:TetR/AcrR family transcriptional regulator [Microbacterium sp. cx-55]|uniref:TetR/AcrR family transcriptional regulator n=1 Tax=unclassified Microbacterium TaxID=2609290 RepID=UPI001CBEADA8|nr:MULTISPECIES: TetR/AcrR family transcriptional regulator [unclassified Microbacterium]MBZ4486744.1 TetR/AcrR family transcriptional regulator [Microbacterium sp. cx-55]MCC4907721.1 TetR/AcrR family transcriptional regulator [Microbacterium sp. cx-59]UGB36299.1 TetR/AcrR family transcriptional regulator [Microbacterium sp. cx-55]